MNEICMILLSIMAVCVIVVCIAVLIDLNLKASYLRGDWYEDLLDRTCEYYFKKLPEWSDRIGHVVDQMLKSDPDVTHTEEDEAE